MVPASRVVYPGKRAPRTEPRRARVLLAAGGAALLFFAAGFFVRTGFFRADRIEIQGTRFIAASDVERETRAALEGSRLLVFPRSHFFFLASGEADQKIRAAFPQIEDVEIEKKFPRRLIVTVRERKLWGLLCARSDPQSPPDHCAYLDAGGIPYDRLSSVSGWLLPVMFMPQDDGVLLPRLFSLFNEAQQALGPLGERVLSLASATSSDDGVRLELASGWRIIALPEQPVFAWARILKIILEKEIGSRRGELEYVDLRFGNKVFYRYRGRSAPQAASPNP